MLRTTKLPKCPHCKRRLENPRLRLHEECQEAWIARQIARQQQSRARLRLSKEKQERAQTKERKAALETPKKLLPKAQKEINRWCRVRDVLAGRGCISCGATYRTAFGGVFDAGHFRSVGSAGHMRFYTPQIRLQCVRCNRDLSGNVVEFRKGLVALFGVPWVEHIESMFWIAKWDVEYLRRLRRVAKKRADRLEKRYAMQG